MLNSQGQNSSPTLKKRNTQKFQDKVDIEQLNKLKEEQFKTALTLFQLTKTYNQEQFKEILPSMKHIDFFQQSCPDSMTLDHYINICVNSLSYEMIKQGNAVYHFGDHGDSIYILMSGAAAVYVQKSQEEILQEYLIREQQWNTLRLKQQELPLFHEMQVMKDRNMFFYLQQKTVNAELVGQDQELYKLNKHKIYFNKSGICRFKKVQTLSLGQYFGEMALSNIQQRTTSIVAQSDLHVVSLSKTDFKKISEKEKKDLADRLNFFNLQFQFKISRYNISLISQYFVEKAIMANQYIWKEDEPVKGFFLIRSGWVQLEVLIDKKQKNKVDLPKNIITYVKKQKLILSTLTAGNFVGEQEVINQKFKYPHSCLTLEQTNFLWISCESFNIMQKLFPEVLEHLQPQLINNKLLKVEQLYLDQQQLYNSMNELPKKTFDMKKIKDYEQQIKQEFSHQGQKYIRFEDIVDEKALIRSHYKQRQSLSDLVDYNYKQQKILEIKSLSYGTDQDYMLQLDPNFQKNVDLKLRKTLIKKQNRKAAVPQQIILKNSKSINENSLITSVCDTWSPIKKSREAKLEESQQASVQEKNYYNQNKSHVSCPYLREKKSTILYKQLKYIAQSNQSVAHSVAPSVASFISPQSSLAELDSSPLLANQRVASTSTYIKSEPFYPLITPTVTSPLEKLKKILKRSNKLKTVLSISPYKSNNEQFDL